LNLLSEALVEYGASTIAWQDVREVIRIVQTFGFHLARIDIRQNSAFHEMAIDQLIHRAGFKNLNYPELSENERLKLINTELLINRPFSRDSRLLNNEAKAVIDTYRIIRKHIEVNSPEAVGSFIVSMTRSVSDLLVVYLLMREAGLTDFSTGNLAAKLHVVPLFETIDDLENAPTIMDQYLSHPVVKSSLRFQQNLRKKI
jgi:phosphoenolpyruvate carboxylase